MNERERIEKRVEELVVMLAKLEKEAYATRAVLGELQAILNGSSLEEEPSTPPPDH